MAEGQSATNTRWVPAKEQIDLLEAMYRKGIRNPSPDQIDQIAGRLRMYGNVEGKNVFYWFQNRKARERKRQKEERVPSIDQFLQPREKSGILIPKGHGTAGDNETINAGNSCERRTLELFPLHPTGMARANPQPVLQELRDDYRDEQNDASSGGGHPHHFIYFISPHPGN
eukprot:PITA_11947